MQLVPPVYGGEASSDINLADVRHDSTYLLECPVVVLSLASHKDASCIDSSVGAALEHL